MRSIVRATKAVIDLRAVAQNAAQIRKLIGNKVKIMAVVKADGYGHGAVEISKVAIKNGADYIAVAIPEEGQLLRESGISSPILVLGLIMPEEAYKVVKYDLTQTVASFEVPKALDKEAHKASKKVNVHIKVDTGLGRIGVNPNDAVHFAHQMRNFKHIYLEGLFSHFSSIYEKDQSFTKQQLRIFNQVIHDIQCAGVNIPLKHIASGDAAFLIPECRYDMIRPGMLIYGLYRSEDLRSTIQLQPAMSFKTRVIAVKTVPPDIPISYGRSFYTNKNTKVATLPVGYADGYRRNLANKADVLIRGHRARVIGRIGMDMCMVDASEVNSVQPGDEVILFGGEISVNEIAARSDTNVDEVLSGVGKRVPRIYRE
jgi:alanine racemase